MKGFTALLVSTVGFAFAQVHAEDCVRGEPIPLFASDTSNVQAHQFLLRSEHEAVESFNVGPTIKVRVVHNGCEYVTLTIRVESANLFVSKYSPALAHQEAAALLLRLKSLRPVTTFDLDKAAATLREASRNKNAMTLSQEFDIHGDGVPPLQAGIKIDSAGRQGATGYIEFTLFRGPL